MKPASYVLPLLAASLVSSVSAATVLVDFNNTVPDSTTGNYNNFSISGTAVTAIGQVGTTLDLNEITTGTDTGWNMTLTKLNAAGNVAATGSGANYTGPYAPAVSGYATTALQDSIYVNNLGQLEVRFTGLDISQTYNLLGYVARGNNAGTGTFDLTVGTVSGSTQVQIHAFNDKATNNSTINWQSITPNASGEIAFVIASTSSAANANTTGINFISLTQVPEPSVALLGGLGVLGLLRRRRSA